MSFMKRSLKQIFGIEKHNLEEVMFCSITFLAAMFTLYYIFYGYLLSLNDYARVVNFISFLGYNLFFYFSRKKGLHQYLFFPFVFFSLLVMAFAWFAQGGSRGAMPYLYLLGFVSFIVIANKKHYSFLFFLVLTNLILVNSLEYYFPDLLGTYSDEGLRKLDVFVGNILTLVFIGLLIGILKRNYTKEREKVSKQKEELEVAYETKTRFLANMSHEIRTPMNGVIGMAAVLGNTPLNSQQREYLNAIEVSGNRLLTIINEILDYSKIEAGEMKLSSEDFSVYKCLIEVFDITAPKAFSKDLNLAYWMESDVPPVIVGDFSKIRQILLNLIGNALKFTSEGDIFVSIKKIEELDNNQVKLQFAIKDTGIGIAEDNIKTLFESFTQIDDSNRREYGGTGLGLAICKEFVSLMQGDIWVESTVGHGATFFFSIVVEHSNDAAVESFEISEADLLKVKGKEILVVEENKINRSLLKRALTKWGTNPHIMASSKEAIEWVKKTNISIDLAIIDYKMPITNGLLLGKIIRNSGALFPMYLLSSHSNLEVVEVSGIFEKLIEKPLKGPLLFNAIAHTFIENKVDKSESIKQNIIDSKMSEKAPFDILLVEDDLVNQKLTISLLELMGYKPDLAKNGEEAILIVQSQKYDLILMDIQLPKKDGFETTKAIRDLVEANSQPIIIAMTANVLDVNNEKCKAVGMDGFLGKPINTPKLEKLLQSFS
jgi:signal transduction histidine kinase/DNA-binding response OmpR family regulator